MSYTKKTEEKAQARKESWTNISGVMKVFGRKRNSKSGDFIGYSTSIGKKQEDGSFENFFFNVRFGKDNNPEKEGVFDIMVNKAFISVDTYKDVNSPVIVIQDFDFC